MQDKTSPRIRKLTQNSSFVQYDKNLMQSNSHSRNREIPIDGYFGEVASLYFWTDNWQTKKPRPESHGLMVDKKHIIYSLSFSSFPAPVPLYLLRVVLNL